MSEQTQTTTTDPVDAAAQAIAWETLTPKGRAECVWPRDWSDGEVAMFRTQAHAALSAATAALARRLTHGR